MLPEITFLDFRGMMFENTTHQQLLWTF